MRNLEAYTVRVVKKPNAVTLTPSKLAEHEAGHAFVAVDVGVRLEYVTINADKNSKGKMIGKGFHPTVTMAGRYYGGAGYDTGLTEALGYNSDAAANDARERIRRKPHAHRAVAIELERRKSLSGSEVEKIVWEADRREEMDEIIVFVDDLDGNRIEFDIEVEKNKDVVIPENVFDIFRAGRKGTPRPRPRPRPAEEPEEELPQAA